MKIYRLPDDALECLVTNTIDIKMTSLDNDTVEVIMPSDFIPTPFEEFIQDDGRFLLPKHLTRLFYANVLLLTGVAMVDIVVDCEDEALKKMFVLDEE
ncbi:hypothetical protein CathTA2_0266 [Caldalkalibacillus thermarum TA2.A1]|uniref:Uncharacterized protein n=1 Tax=Caldalkalibacillus thermarum (strain TA2.A1) TaxID=986075 RepID=F5L3A4_CALTT|nr:hypothetical protein [Caldalkalibacillus thermarum]EGL84181.1 hypothetical protein CathTA2_0266 [Caldalkalibacillus thermarum TA2.A1]QZT34705.1 hypothetical protein HUR95_05195 [Caldalkalibacillus thermarum TA2.A1]